ncbi:DUF2924 domain-containing protein [Thermopirellula anaerolimosa]
MALNIERELAAMARMTPKELQEKYAQVFGYQPRSRNKQWMLKRIAWRLQANQEGDLSERARRRATELANDADLRLTAPRLRKRSPDGQDRTVTLPARFSGPACLPPAGTILTRQYKGRVLQVRVLPDAFEYEGQVYKSLTAVARAITGVHWNGYHFFGLTRRGDAQ